MGIAEYYAMAVRGEAAEAIDRDHQGQLDCRQLGVDANSVVYPAVYKVSGHVNRGLYQALSEVGARQPSPKLAEFAQQYGLRLDLTDRQAVIRTFTEHFTADRMDELIIQAFTDAIWALVHDHFQPRRLRTLGLFFDGPPSKGKMVEQRTRRTIGSVQSEYSDYLYEQMKDSLSSLERDYAGAKISWPTTNITPGTTFMDRLDAAMGQLAEDPSTLFGDLQPRLKIRVSGSNEFGEGEKKIVQWMEARTLRGGVCICSPDADMIILMQLQHPGTPLYIIRHDQQESAKQGRSVWGVINIDQYRDLLSAYINRQSGDQYEADRLNYDIAAASTVLGNDFVPRIPTVAGSRNINHILSAYLRCLEEHPGRYLIHTGERASLSWSMFTALVDRLVPMEHAFLEAGELANKVGVRNAQWLTWVFQEERVTPANVQTLVGNLKRYWKDAGEAIRCGRLTETEEDDRYLLQVKRGLTAKVPEVEDLTLNQLIPWLREYHKQHGHFPSLQLSTYAYQPSLRDRRHAEATRGLNPLEMELYQFRELLGPYQTVLNQSTTDWGPGAVNRYYEQYWGWSPVDAEGNLSPELIECVRRYLQGVLWVVEYYYNGDTTPSRWYYPYEQAPLLQHISAVLYQLGRKGWRELRDELEHYRVDDLREYWTPAEQFAYVCPLTPSNISLMPAAYGEWFQTRAGREWLSRWESDIPEYVQDIYRHRFPTPRRSQCWSCRDTVYLSKCSIEGERVWTDEEDREWLASLREHVHPADEPRTRTAREFRADA